MRLYLPDGDSRIEIPDTAPHAAPRLTVVHNKVWEQYGKPGDLCLAEDLEGENLVSFLVKSRASGVLQINRRWFARDFETCVLISENPGLFFSDPVKVTLPRVQKNLCWEFSANNDKEQIRRQLFQHTESGNIVVRDAISAVFEELFMNAMLDAPRTSLQSNVETKPYEKHGPARLHFGVERERLCLACEDPYGTLNVDRFINRMNEVYTRGAGEAVNLKTEQGGAGLGCILLFENSSSVFIGARPGECSVVACVIPTDVTHRQKDIVRKSLFVVRGGEHGKV